MHGDHLGSTSKTTGAASSAQLYEAYGAKRGSSEVDTPYRYTGQRWEENDALDIYYYKARWYDPQLGRFLQPDPFVPEAGNPQNLNRYSYTLNNPMRYIDPTGFILESEVKAAQDILDLLAEYEVSVNKDWGYRWTKEGAAYWFEGSWQYEELSAVKSAVEALGSRLGAESGTSATDAFRQHIGAVYFERHKTPDLSYRWTVAFAGTPAAVYVVGAGKIKVYNETFTGKLSGWNGPFPEGILVHELGHAWDAKPGVWGSELIRGYVGKERPPTGDAKKGDASEHWAETVYAWTYPDRPDVQGWSGHPGLGPWHAAFISFAVQGFRMSGESEP